MIASSSEPVAIRARPSHVIPCARANSAPSAAAASARACSRALIAAGSWTISMQVDRERARNLGERLPEVRDDRVPARDHRGGGDDRRARIVGLVVRDQNDTGRRRRGAHFCSIAQMPRAIAAAHTTPPNASIRRPVGAGLLVRGGVFAAPLADDADGERDGHEHARQQHDDADLPERSQVDVVAQRGEDHVAAAAGPGAGAREIHLHLDHVVGADRVAARQDHEAGEDRDRDRADDERSAHTTADEPRPAVGCRRPSARLREA